MVELLPEDGQCHSLWRADLGCDSRLGIVRHFLLCRLVALSSLASRGSFPQRRASELDTGFVEGATRVTELLPLDAAGLAFIGGYLVILLGIGYWSYRARRTNSMRDFYLAGDGIGFVVLLLTLYATQYSGNTLFGFPGKTYRIGYSWLIAVHFMTAIVCVYVFFAPQLHRLSQRHSLCNPH